MTIVRSISAESDEWDSVVSDIPAHDVYHYAGYQRACASEAETPLLIVVKHEGETVALPIALRSLSNIKGMEGIHGTDAVSLYGYPGAITTATPSVPFAAVFQQSLTEVLRELDAVSLFVRQNPLIHTSWLFDPKTVSTLGQTVALDLTIGDEQLRALANSNHRRNLKKTANSLSPTFEVDVKWEHIDAFIDNYNATMTRNAASDQYFFSRAHYAALQQELGDKAVLFHATVDGVRASSVLAFVCNGIVQYHLGGTSDETAPLGLARWTLEQVRIWATTNSQSWFHLGGGVGASEDALFRFKSGFGKTLMDYDAVRLITDEARYHELVDHRTKQVARALEPEFFPIYRS